MSIMYGDPLEELRYREWKKSMMRVTKANPPKESRRVPNGSHLLNETIFRHLQEQGISLNTLEASIPKGSNDRTFVGKLYNEELYINSTGRLEFHSERYLPEPPPRILSNEDIIIEPECTHGFVVRDVDGENRFLCKECDERFPRHPSMMPRKTKKFKDAPFSISHALHERNILSNFREGMITLADTCRATTFSVEELTEAMQKAFPPEMETDEIHVIGELQPRVVNLRERPKRVSSYQDIDAIFGNPNVTMEDINKVVNAAGVFPDVTQVSHHMDQKYGAMIVEVSFIDGSTQRVEIPKDQVYMSRRPYQGGF